MDEDTRVALVALRVAVAGLRATQAEERQRTQRQLDALSTSIVELRAEQQSLLTRCRAYETASNGSGP